MVGKIVKGIAGFYYVYTQEAGILECKAKGIFRKEQLKPLVGDDVEVEVLSTEEHTGNVSQILQRKSALIRPNVANVDQALLIFACTHPEPNLNLLDRFLIMMEGQNLPVIICFNKMDLATETERERLASIYEKAGYRVVFSCGKERESLMDVKEALKGKTTTVAGPSGVGKSTIINALLEEERMETGDISKKIERGKHTTRHSELFALEDNTFIMDTPGFSSLSLFDVKKEDLWKYYPEFTLHEPKCRFTGCMHDKEPDCGVKAAVESGEIARERYENYATLLEALMHPGRS